MMTSLCGLLATCIIVGMLFIVLGLKGQNESTAQFVIVIAGMILIIGGATGAMRLKKLRYG